MFLKLKSYLSKIANNKKKTFFLTTKVFFWFSLGAIIGFFFFTSFLFIIYQKLHANTVYSGVSINGIDFSGKTSEYIKKYYQKQNEKIGKTVFLLSSPDATATISGKQINLGYNGKLLADQAFSIGRTGNTLSNISLILNAYMNSIDLSPSYTVDESKLDEITSSLQSKIHKEPVDALFNFQDGKVIELRKSINGQDVDISTLKKEILAQMENSFSTDTPQLIIIPIPIISRKPTINIDNVSTLGIKELVSVGTSLFYHSIENRVYNISLAANKLNGTLIAPNEVFSFDKTIGDISVYTGYKQAYVIENGHTVLGDGGGVCQVSTTLFRAALNAGLPIVERNPHAYRVGYYEEDSAPGIDAAVYWPSVDLKFKNDTGHYLLIQSHVDEENMRLTFEIYGTKDNREVTITQPVILNQTPPPPDLYQDDPTLPKGTVKQVDFSAWGANVYFTRTVKKDGKVFLSDKFVSNYRPWQAVYLRGTQ